MRETTTDYIHGERIGTWYSSDSNTIRRMKKIVEKYPSETKVVIDDSNGEDSSYEIEIPKSWLRDPRPPIKRKMTKEQLEDFKDRMRSSKKQ